ncbi:glycoside hydrolase family 2 [Glaciihabitans arcticus]|uniref:Glycoside hydrolase family 2 n=1 Tax=Glaciihabitans arcticus TaxID=2668039 RepID=A0A4Q9GV05_9MICO|nr:glycoside hydrolase family 2 TIM barrel-domain containing protein [Glaciihabitans arcticus]TBN56423.1 glycoside hydrolase family 2 [Glaciihabitans arcticus]
MQNDGAQPIHAAVRASQQSGEYPRPQLMRENWVDLSGSWTLRFDDDDAGLAAGWHDSRGFDSPIVVPFPPESADSGIGDTGFHRVLWYHHAFTVEPHAEPRTVLHFGAVDYRCSVWLNGIMLGSHEGGNTPFDFDVTTALVEGEQQLVVRVEDDPLDVAQPRGKQDWKLEPHEVWYHRTSGIWQPVWLEHVASVSIKTLAWRPDVPSGTVRLELDLSQRASHTANVRVSFDGVELANQSVTVESDHVELVIPLQRQRNGQDYEQLLWSVDHPRLLDAMITLGSGDVVHSYFGLRSVAVERGSFMLNDRPVYLRSVLSQGYWPSSHLAAPSADALRAEVQLIKDLGFNAARVHQKIEDPRFLFWADRLGLLLWEEMPSAYEFSATAIRRMMTEWADVIQRDASHPSVVTWVPFNESWGVQHIAHDPAVRDYVRALWHLTKALDPTRPVVSNDGWEHLDSDIWSVHDYESSGDVLRARYASASSIFDGLGPAGRRMRLGTEPDRGQPIMLTEFGGIKFAPQGDDSWGYSTASSAADFASRLSAVLDATLSSPVLAGFCYTQLTDTGQETNGLVTDAREPKLPLDQLRAIITAPRTNLAG